MAFNVEIAGIQGQLSPETRNLVFLKAYYDDQVYSWSIYVPTSLDPETYVQANKDRIKKEIDLKEQEWINLDPKTRIIFGENGEEIIIDIAKDEIVRPDVPDYYAKRRLEYPDLGDQFDSFWKGFNSIEYIEMQEKILEVKQKYPKIYIDSDLEELKASKLQYITIMRNSTLNTLSAEWNNDTWDADEGTSTRIANVLTMIEQANASGILTPSAIPWRTYDNQDRYLTVPELVQLGASIFSAQQVVWTKQANLKNQIISALTIEEINSITW